MMQRLACDALCLQVSSHAFLEFTCKQIISLLRIITWNYACHISSNSLHTVYFTQSREVASIFFKGESE